jgi:hypothetical protein
LQFHAAEPKVPLMVLSLLMFLLFILSHLFIFLCLAILCLSFTKVTYHFSVNSDHLSFNASLFGIDILKRKARKENIKWIEFKRTGWYKKSLFIRLEKGVRWKVSRFQPNNFADSVESFASSNGIKVKKHKNY